MNIAEMNDLWVTFNVREDHLSHFKQGATIETNIPALGKENVKMTVFHMKDLGSYATWKATKTTGQFDMKTFEVKVRPDRPIEGLRPGMSVLLNR